MIEVQHLTKRYGSHLAVDDLSFSVQQGVIYGLLGPNGAGKSTTMNILTGYISATSGTVTIDGHDVLEEPGAARACIGYLPEQPPLYPDMTVEEYLRFAAELKGVRRAERFSQVEKAMARTGLESVGRRLIRNLSKGYKQRVGLAGALMGSPKVIILDEPTVGLDPAQMIEIRALIRDLGRTHTVILSSHILSEVQAVCDQVLIIAHGRLVAQGTPDELAGRLEGHQTLTATAQGEAARVLAAAAGVEGLTDVTLTGEKDGEVSFTANAPAGRAERRPGRRRVPGAGAGHRGRQPGGCVPAAGGRERAGAGHGTTRPGAGGTGPGRGAGGFRRSRAGGGKLFQ